MMNNADGTCNMCAVYWTSKHRNSHEINLKNWNDECCFFKYRSTYYVAKHFANNSLLCMYNNIS